jgi:zinc transporter ZupT
MNYLIILILTTGAIIGGFAVFFVKKDHPQRLKLILAFSGAYLFAITVLHLLPDVYQGNNHEVGLFILGGFILQILLEQFSDGIEHGHIHKHSHQKSFPWGIMLSLSLHAFLEGMPIAAANNQELVLGIAIHHIPAAFALGSVLLSNHISKQTTSILLVVFALMSPFGYLFSFSLKNGALLGEYYSSIMGIVIGIFLHISTTILFESTVDHRFTLKKTLAVSLGIILALAGYLLH